MYTDPANPSNNGHHKNGQSKQSSEKSSDPMQRLQHWIDNDSLSTAFLIPTAEELVKYETLLPGAAERILILTEKAQKLHTLKTYSRIRLHRHLIWLSTFISAFLLFIALFGVITGAEWFLILPFALCSGLPFFLIKFLDLRK